MFSAAERLSARAAFVVPGVDSRNRHATAHFTATEHPVMRSIEPGESWGWCYVDRVEL